MKEETKIELKNTGVMVALYGFYAAAILIGGTLSYWQEKKIENKIKPTLEQNAIYLKSPRPAETYRIGIDYLDGDGNGRKETYVFLPDGKIMRAEINPHCLTGWGRMLTERVPRNKNNVDSIPEGCEMRVNVN